MAPHSRVQIRVSVLRPCPDLGSCDLGKFDEGAQRALDLRWWSRRGRGAEGRGRDGKRGGGGVL